MKLRVAGSADVPQLVSAPPDAQLTKRGPLRSWHDIAMASNIPISIALYFYYTQEPPAGLFAANCRGFLDPHNPSPFACSKSWRTRPTRPHVLPAVVRLPLPSLLLVLLHQQRRVEAVSLRNNRTQGEGEV